MERTQVLDLLVIEGRVVGVPTDVARFCVLWWMSAERREVAGAV